MKEHPQATIYRKFLERRLRRVAEKAVFEVMKTREDIDYYNYLRKKIRELDKEIEENKHWLEVD